jgi:hypothetical protein
VVAELLVGRKARGTELLVLIAEILRRKPYRIGPHVASLVSTIARKILAG